MYTAAKGKVVEADFSRQAVEVPPQNIEAEEAILGAILLDPEAIARIADTLSPSAFYLQFHQKIYQACLALHEAGNPPDLMMVATYLADNKLLDQVGGQSKLAQLVETVVSSVNIDRYALLVVDKYRRRQLISTGNEIVRLGYEIATELEIVFDEAEKKVFDLTQDEISDKIESPADILMRVYENAQNPKPRGLLSGIYDLDALMGGFKPKCFYIVAGRTGMGKTHFLVALAAQALEKKEPVLFFSAEMDRDQLMTRVLAWKSGVDAKKIEQGKVISKEDLSALTKGVTAFSDAPLYLDDTPGSCLTPSKIRSTIRRAAKTLGQVPKIVLIDYIQLLGSDRPQSNRVVELDRISRACKEISKEFNLPVVTAAQISREVEGKNDKRPTIANLREAGGLEQESDGIILLYRDDYYNPNSPDKGICEVILGKQRSGPTGVVKTLIHLETSRFDNLANSASKDFEDRMSYSNRVTNNESEWEEEF